MIFLKEGYSSLYMYSNGFQLEFWVCLNKKAVCFSDFTNILFQKKHELLSYFHICSSSQRGINNKKDDFLLYVINYLF